MNRDLPIHENAAFNFVRASSSFEAFWQARWAPFLAEVNGIFNGCGVQGLLAHMRWLADEVVMEGHLIAGGFRAARSCRSDPLSTDGPFVPELWFRE